MPNEEWPHHLYEHELTLDVSTDKENASYYARVVGCVLYRSGRGTDLWTTGFVGWLSAEDKNPPAPTQRDDIQPFRIKDRELPDGKVLSVKAISIADDL